MAAVPNTETFTLQDVCDAIFVTVFPPTHPNDLQECFDEATSRSFDTNYNTDNYAPANSMLRFRNYGGSSSFNALYSTPNSWTFASDDSGVSKVFNITINPDATFTVATSGDDDEFTVTSSQAANTVTVTCDGNNTTTLPYDMTITLSASGYPDEEIFVRQDGQFV